MKTGERTWRRAAAGLSLAVAALFAAPAGAQTVSVTPPTLTEADLDGAVLTVTLAGTTFASIPEGEDIPFELRTTNIRGLTSMPPAFIPGGTTATLALVFGENGDAFSTRLEEPTLTVWVGRDIHGGSVDLTDSVTVTPSDGAKISPERLTEDKLDGATLTIELTHTTFVSGVSPSDFTLAPAIPGLSISHVSGGASGDTTATLTLAFTGDVSTAETLAVRVPAAAHAGGDPLTPTVRVDPVTPSAAISTNPAPLTEANLDGAKLIVALTNSTFASGVSASDFEPVTEIQDLRIVGDPVVTSDRREATLTLAFTGDVSTAEDLAVEVKQAAHTSRGDLTTGAVTVTPGTMAPPPSAAISTNPAPLTEADLDGATLTVALTHTTFASGVSASDFALVTAIPGLSIAGEPVVASDRREATLTLAFTGDVSTDETLAVTVTAAAHAGSRPLTTESVTVAPAPPSAAISSTTPAPLARENLDGARLTVALTHTTFASGVSASDFALVTAIPGLSIAGDPVVASDRREATLTLAFTGIGDASTDETLAVTVTAAAHTSGGDLTTGTVTVTPETMAPPPSAAISSTTPAPLTRENLDGAKLTVALTHTTFASGVSASDFKLVTAIPGLSIAGEPVVASDRREATLTLAFTGIGDASTDETLAVTVTAEAHTSGGDLTTGTVTVTPGTMAPPPSAAISSTTPAPLTEADLDGAKLTVALTNSSFASGVSASDFALVTAIPGLSIAGEPVVASDRREATLTLAFTGDVSTDETLAVTVTAAAHAGSRPLTTEPVTVAPAPPSAAISSTNPAALTEADLDGAKLIVALTSSSFASGVSASDFALVTAIPGLSIAGDPVVASDRREAALTLAFTGDVSTDETLAVTVTAAAHVGGGDLTTAPVTAAPSDAAAISSTDPAALTEADLDGAKLTLALAHTTFAGGVAATHFELVTAIPGVSVSGVSGAAAGGRAATLTLAFRGDLSADEVLAVRVAAAAHVGGRGLTTGTVTVLDAAPRARLKAVNESVLPELSRAMWGSVLDAVTGRLESPGGGAAPATAAGGLAAAAQVLRTNERALEDGSASWKALAGGESFAFGLGAGGDGASGGPGAVVWGVGDWRNLARKERALDWSGDLFAAHLGVDAGPGRDLRSGLAASWFSSEIDYTDRSGAAAVEGVHESRMTMLTPWLAWGAGDGTRVWTAAGYGWGEIEIVDADRPAGSGRQSADSRLLGVAAGGAKRLWSEGALTLDLKGSAEATHHEVEDNGDEIAGLSVETRRLRLAAEGARMYAFAGGASLTSTVEAGVRHDGGDGATGRGVEVGGGLSWTDPARGLTVEVRSRVLAAHRRNVDDWGASGALRLDPGAEGRGLSFRLRSSFGAAAGSGAAGRWEEAAVFPDRADDGRRPAAGRLETELGYGLPVFAGAGAATPYTGLAFARDGEREARIGARIGLRAGLDLDLRATRDRARSGALDHGIELRAAARW